MLSDRSWNYFYQTSSFSLILNLICSPGTVFQQRRRLFPFLLLPTQALCCGDMERDAWPVQHCASLGMELLCAQSFSHCFGLYGENICALKGPHLSKCAYCTNEHCTLQWENNCAAWSWYESQFELFLFWMNWLKVQLTRAAFYLSLNHHHHQKKADFSSHREETI